MIFVKYDDRCHRWLYSLSAAVNHLICYFIILLKHSVMGKSFITTGTIGHKREELWLWQRRHQRLHFLLSVTFSLSILSNCLALRSMPTDNLSHKERESLRREARDMFYHAYYAYMNNAYPADELMPLSCKGRYRGVTPSRGDMDDILGNFSMTLVDTLDTLVILGDLPEFERAVKLVIRDVQFDTDVIVSVFETNIRMMGGLLSAHILTEYLQRKADVMHWYKGELLEMAHDLGYRLLPAFNTTMGIPHARINLRYAMKDERLKKLRETCTACAGTILLEFAALSRLTGDPVFEARAHAAMDSLWKLRHRGSDLMGTVLNVHSGDWIRRDSGVGAGIDSYYEYLFKSYILLGDHKYLARFNRHYNAVMKYVSEGPMLLDVLMHRPHAKSRNFMDALLAFWPGLQVLSGDLKPAVQTHEMLYQVMQMHKFIPEAFTTDFEIHWAQHHLRPEFIESTYFLYRATGDHYYLQVGKKVLEALQKYARVPCGYAAVNDLRTGKHEDRMDSFVLSETLKYLYLLFTDPQDLIVNIDEFVFTTEAHLLPLSLAHLGNTTYNFRPNEEHQVMDFMRSCPSSSKFLPEKVREPLRNMMTGSCPRITTAERLHALDFQASNAEHLRSIFEMGITMVALGDGKVRLFHSFYNAKSHEDGEMGLLFMQEMANLQSIKAIAQLQAVVYQGKENNVSKDEWTVLMAGPSHFGTELSEDQMIEGEIVMAEPRRACSDQLLANSPSIVNKILIAERGDCTFVKKARSAEAAGAVALIICDNVPGTTGETQPLFAMSGDAVNNVSIPVVFIYSQEFQKLSSAFEQQPDLRVRLMSMMEFNRRHLGKNLKNTNSTTTTTTTTTTQTIKPPATTKALNQSERLEILAVIAATASNATTPALTPPLVTANKTDEQNKQSKASSRDEEL